ncbi:ester cyclase [Haloarcula marina]|uniref:ester cyclase n=1 Tax=Haloarcula marina TaxID=2961574 RepID=UPI0020B8A93A|nr:ester cyclase [Halomicroarcula marina]
MVSITRRDAPAVVDAYLAVWNERAYETIRDIVAPSFVMYEPGAPDGTVRGPGGVEEWIREFATGFPDLQITVGDVLADDGVVMFDATFTGTHDGDFDGIPPTGQRVEINFMDKMEVEDGRIQREWVYYEPQELAAQLDLDEE